MLQSKLPQQNRIIRSTIYLFNHISSCSVITLQQNFSLPASAGSDYNSSFATPWPPANSRLTWGQNRTEPAAVIDATVRVVSAAKVTTRVDGVIIPVTAAKHVKMPPNEFPPPLPDIASHIPEAVTIGFI